MTTHRRVAPAASNRWAPFPSGHSRPEAVLGSAVLASAGTMVEILHALESGRPHSLQPPAAAAAAAGEGDRSYAHPRTTVTEVQLAECGLDPSRTQPSQLEPLECGQESEPDQPVLASAVIAAPIPSQSLQPEPVD